MGFSGGVGVINRDDFKFDMSHFKAALLNHWPDVHIREVFDGDIDFGMTIKGEYNDFLGSTINQQQVGWWADYDELAEFCLWLRQYISNQYELLAWDGDFNNYVVVGYSTNEEQIVKGLSESRFYFEIEAASNTLEEFKVIADSFKDDWPESLAFTSPDVHGIGHWFLHAQQGWIGFDSGKISLDDNDLQLAAQIVIWCRNLLPNDQKLTVRGGHYPKPPIQVETELSATTTEDKLFDFLTKSFSKEQSS